MHFVCELCGIKTDRKANFKIHIASTVHKDAVSICSDEELQSYCISSLPVEDNLENVPEHSETPMEEDIPEVGFMLFH